MVPTRAGGMSKQTGMTARGGVWDLAGEAGRLQNGAITDVPATWLARHWSLTPSPHRNAH